ncbi:MAG TPA: 16S rRNA (guanine(527)-N(7))-methyltransferase RsmG [Desulfuromonadaceae bacterium]
METRELNPAGADVIRHAIEQGAKEAGLTVPETGIHALECFAAELQKWNRTVNLTAITADDEIAIKHFIDSLIFAGYVRDDDRVLDVGSGAGIPAIPLKIFKPAVNVVSVDAVGKKILFQRHVARLLKLEGFEAIHARVESLYSSRAGCFDVITSRAFSRLEQFVGLAHPLLADGGRMIAMKGPAAEDEMTRAADTLRDLGYEISRHEAYRLPFGMGERSLIVITPCKAR